MKRLTAGLVAVTALVAGGVAAATAPGESGVLAPFAVYGAPGIAVSSRALTAEVVGVRAAEQIIPEDELDPQAITTSEVWVVVECIVTPELRYTSLLYVELEIGDRTFRNADVLPSPSMSTLPYGAGVPLRGSLVFEIPASALSEAGASSARVVFNPGISTRLDSIPVIVVDLTGVEVEDEVSIAPPFVPDADD